MEVLRLRLNVTIIQVATTFKQLGHKPIKKRATMRSRHHFEVAIENRGWSKENGCNKKLGLRPEGRQGISIEVTTQFTMGNNGKIKKE